MVNILVILFWSAIFLILTTYVIYPLLVIKFPFSKPEPDQFTADDDLPEVTIIMAAYNEKEVIEAKLESVFQTNYPAHKVQVLVGSDNSNDGTDQIVLELTRKYPNLQLVQFKNRTGKSGIINTLVSLSKTDVLVCTDANIFFEKDTIFQLVKRFKEQAIDVVGGNIIYQSRKNDGIAVQEHMYLNLENRIKHAEAKRWWAVMGVEGGCYAIRKKAFSQIPPLTFMEDFYITMAALTKGGNVWFEPEARCFEDVSTEIREEFKRKIRISIGNWQNLNRFAGLLFTHFWPIGMSFFCHKVLRWFTPFLAIFAFGSAILLASQGNLYSLFTMTVVVLLLLLPLDFALMKRNMHTGILRFINHFVLMNIALLTGFLHYSKGIKSNVWQPTKRNQ